MFQHVYAVEILLALGALSVLVIRTKSYRESKLDRNVAVTRPELIYANGNVIIYKWKWITALIVVIFMVWICIAPPPEDITHFWSLEQFSIAKILLGIYMLSSWKSAHIDRLTKQQVAEAIKRDSQLLRVRPGSDQVDS